MGMKSKSAHFGSGSGGPSKREGSLKFKANLQMFAKMPTKRAQVMHIMANRKGHLINTPENRKILETISDNESNYVFTNHNGNRVYAKVINGNQYWVYARNGIIQDGGINKPGEHRNFKSNKSTKRRKWIWLASQFNYLN